MITTTTIICVELLVDRYMITNDWLSLLIQLFKIIIKYIAARARTLSYLYFITNPPWFKRSKIGETESDDRMNVTHADACFCPLTNASQFTRSKKKKTQKSISVFLRENAKKTSGRGSVCVICFSAWENVVLPYSMLQKQNTKGAMFIYARCIYVLYKTICKIINELNGSNEETPHIDTECGYGILYQLFVYRENDTQTDPWEF